MRWPWQRERPEPPPGQEPREAAAPAAAEPRIAPAGWAFLPPLQRSAGSIQLTSDPDHFTGSLASWGDPSFTGPMTHLVSTQAPAGVIDVDGGGPDPGSGGYTAPSVEMTLLPPPAPHVRPVPGRLGGMPTIQRAGTDGGTQGGNQLGGDWQDGGWPDGDPQASGTLDGLSLTAAAPDAFPVLHVDAAPLQSPGSSPGPSVSAPVSRGEPSGPSRTRSTDGSTSDGSATYVPLPSAPAVQRASTPADSSPSFRQAPHPPRLGLGMPLSFSELAATPEFCPGTAPDVFPDSRPGSFPLPVQRTSTPETAGAPVVPPAADASIRGASAPDAVDATLPGNGGGTAPGPATTSAVPSDPPSLDSTGAPDPGIGEPAPWADAGTTTATVSPPADDAPAPDDGSAPPLSATGSAGAIDRAGDSHPGANDPAPRTTEGNPASMPVVSRSGHAVDLLSNVTDAGHGSDSLETFGAVSFPALSSPAVSSSAVREAARPVNGPPEPALTIHPDIPRVDERPAAAPLPLVLGPATGQQAMPAGSPSVQRSLSDDSPAETAPHAEELTAEELAAPAAALAPVQGQSAESSSDEPRASGQTGAVKPTTDPSSSPHGSLGIQRTAKPAAELQTRAIPTSVGPVVLRIVPAAGPGPATDTWQRLTALPVAAPAPRAQARALTLPAATRPAHSPANTAWPDEGQQGVAAAATAFAPTADMPSESDNGLGIEGDSGPRTESGFLADAAPGAEPDAPPGLSAAVGRVIQRTISVERYSAEGTRPLDAAATGFPAGSAPPTQVLTVPPTPPHGGEQPARLQRLSASAGPVPGAVGSTPERTATLGYFSNTSFTAIPTGPGAHAAFESGSDRPQDAILSLASPSPQRDEGGEAVQRETGLPGSDSAAAAPVVPARAASGPGEADGGVAVQGGTDAGPAGSAEQGPAVRGATASGIPAGATPEQLEDLAKRLAGPLIRRIKAEMLLDRERRGLRTDTN